MTFQMTFQMQLSICRTRFQVLADLTDSISCIDPDVMRGREVVGEEGMKKGEGYVSLTSDDCNGKEHRQLR